MHGFMYLAVNLKWILLGGVQDIPRIHAKLVKEQIPVLDYQVVSAARIAGRRRQNRGDLVGLDQVVNPVKLRDTMLSEERDPDFREAGRGYPVEAPFKGVEELRGII